MAVLAAAAGRLLFFPLVRLALPLLLAAMLAGCGLRGHRVPDPGSDVASAARDLARPAATLDEAAAPPRGPAPSDPRMAPAGRGLSLRQRLTAQSALSLTAGSGPRPVAPDMRVTLGFQYSF